MTGEGQAWRREVVGGLGGWAPCPGGTASSEHGVAAGRGVAVGSAETWTVAARGGGGGRPRSRRWSWWCRRCCCCCAAGWTPRQPPSGRRGCAPPVITSAPVSGAVLFLVEFLQLLWEKNQSENLKSMLCRKIIGWSYFIDKMI